jgi:hypothetical protein
MLNSRRPAVVRTALIVAAILVSSAHVKSALAQSALSFTAGDLVVSVEGNGSNTAATQSGNTSAAGTYLDDQAAPLTLFEYSLNGSTGATQVGSLMLPQTSTAGGNYAVSGEYGSSSEGTLQLSGNGQYLTIMGYATNAQSYNASADLNGNGTALAQSPNAVGGGSGTVLRDIALISANGTVNSTTAVGGVFNGNNPRSVFTQDGTSFYISGQGNKDLTGGVFYVSNLGATSATAITGADTHSSSNGTFNQDTRDVQIVNGQLVVSVDSTEGKVSAGTNIDRIGTLTAPGGGLPTTTLNQQPTALPGINGAVALSNGNGNSINGSTGSAYLSPEGFFYANSTTLYVADSGEPKNGSSQGTANGPNPGDGGLQKWSLVNGSWQLDYTLAAGLNLVPNDNDETSGTGHGVSGLEGLAGKVVNGQVELFATSYVLGDTDQTYLYGITDTLGNTTASQAAGESFTTLAAAPADSEFKGVSFAPVPLPSGISLLLGGLAAFGIVARRGTRPRLTV